MNIKRTAVWILFLACALILPAAEAQTSAPPDEVTALCAVQYPGYTVSAAEDSGSQLALILSRDGHNVLCIAEQPSAGAAYAFTVETDTAVRQGDQIPDLLIDTGGDALFYSYQDESQISGETSYYTYRYHAAKTQTGWGNVDMIIYHQSVTEFDDFTSVRYYETFIGLQGSDLMITKYICDENDNPTSRTVYSPVYAPWLLDEMSLAAFDITAWPSKDPSALYARSALALLPEGYAVNKTTLTSAALMAEAVDARGVRTLTLIQTEEDGTRRITQSVSLPENVTLDFIHAWTSIGIRVYPDFDIKEDYSIYSFQEYADGLWHLSGVMTEEDIFNYLSFGLETDLDTLYIGDNPAIDLTTADWDALPASLAQALDDLDQSDWARVISDDPDNRLHLRAAPNRSAESLGKYYQGTPVRVLGTQGEWTEVSVFGVHGYMMTKWLAFGADMNGVETATLWLTYKYEALEAGLPVYASPSDSVPIATLTLNQSYPDPYIIGVVGDTWYHIVFPETGLSGYIRQDTLWPGNG